MQRRQQTIARLTRNPDRPHRPVVPYFHPDMPRFEPDTTIDVGGTKVFDHSKFGVTLQNTSDRTVEIESIVLTSVGSKGCFKSSDGWSRCRAVEL